MKVKVLRSFAWGAAGVTRVFNFPMEVDLPEDVARSLIVSKHVAPLNVIEIATKPDRSEKAVRHRPLRAIAGAFR